MSAIFKQLEKHLVISEPYSTEKSLDDTDFTTFAENAWLWRVQYQALKAQTAVNPTKKNLEDSLYLATRLEALHEKLNEAPTAFQYTNDKAVLKQLLDLPVDLPQDKPVTEPIDLVRMVPTYDTDSTRLLIGHIRRFCVIFLMFPETFDFDLTWAKQFADALAPTLTLLGFLIYVPRSVINSLILLELCFETQEIPLLSRLQAHCEINDRLFNFVNDAPTVIGGFITVFLLTGATLPLAAYITVLVKLAEVIFAALKAYYDISRLEAMRAEYDAHEDGDDKKSYLKSLDATIEHIKGTRYATLAMHTILLFCLSVFIPPVMILSPWLSIAAVVCAIGAVMLRFAWFRDLWIAPAPEDDLSNLKSPASNGFFQSEQTEADNTTPKAENYPSGLTSERPPVQI